MIAAVALIVVIVVAALGWYYFVYVPPTGVPHPDRYIKDCPQFCDLIIDDWGGGMLEKMNPKAKLLMTKCMAKGDDVCNIILEIEE